MASADGAGLVSAAVRAAVLAEAPRRTVSAVSAAVVSPKQLARDGCRASELEVKMVPHEVRMTMLQVVLRPCWRH